MFLDFKMDKNQTVTQTIPTTYNGFIYVLSDTAYIGDPNSETEVKAHHTLIFSEDSTSTVRIQTKDEAAHFVLIAGEPLREPAVQIGPLVENSSDEIYRYSSRLCLLSERMNCPFTQQHLRLPPHYLRWPIRIVRW